MYTMYPRGLNHSTVTCNQVCNVSPKAKGRLKLLRRVAFAHLPSLEGPVWGFGLSHCCFLGMNRN